MPLNKYFNMIYVVLDDDANKTTIHSLNRQKIKYEIVKLQDNTIRGDSNLSLDKLQTIQTQIKIIKMAFENKSDKILVINGNLTFTGKIDQMLSKLSKLPSKWDIISFQKYGNLKSDYIKMNGINKESTLIYGISYACYQDFLNLLSQKNRPLEHCLIEVQKKGNSFIVNDDIIKMSQFSIKPKFLQKNSTNLSKTIVPQISSNSNQIYNTHIDTSNFFKYDLKQRVQEIDPNDDNRIVQSLWIGPNLSLMETLCIRSFIYFGHEFHLYTYGQVNHIPEGCIVKDGNEILPESEIFYYSNAAGKGKGSVSAFSNMFRYKLLLDKGNYWVDMDMICLKYFAFDTPYLFSSEKRLNANGEQVVNAGVIKCPPNSDFATYCYNICKNKDKNKLRWGEIGPSLIKDGVAKILT